MLANDFNVLIRKMRALIVRSGRRIASLCRIFLVRAITDDVTIPWSTSIGRCVSIRITDGAQLRLGAGCAIGANTVIIARNGVIELSDDVYIGHGCTIVALESIRIGARTLLAEYVTVRDQDHKIDHLDKIFDAGFDIAPIEIGNDAWIAAKVSVLRGSKIGIGAVIGAHSVVRGTIPNYAVAVGSPAKIIRYREVS